jgi:hypothetical protein
MIPMRLLPRLAAAILLSTAFILSGPATAEGLNPNQQRAFDVYKELIEIDTVTATGDTAKAAEAPAALRTPMSTCSRPRRARAIWWRA